jgi:hypothetical protein
MRRLCCHDRQLSSDVHLVCRQVLHLELHLVHRLQQNHHRLLLDEVHQNRLDDLRQGDLLHLVHQNRLDDLRRQVRLDVDRQNHLGDLHLDDPVHLGERPLDEVRQLRRRRDEVQRCRMKMDYCQHAVDVVLK